MSISIRNGAQSPWPKLVLLSLVVTPLTLETTASAEDVLFVAGYGGTTETTIRHSVLEPFAAEHGIRIEYVAGTSASNLSRLKAQKDHQEIDVAILDDGPMQEAVDLGLCEVIAPFPAANRLYALAKQNGAGRSLGIGLVATGIAYNRDVFEREGWPAPGSWLDLADPRYNARLLVPSISNSYGLHTLIGLAKSLGTSDVSQALDFVKAKVAPQIVSFETASGKISELFQTGEVAVGVWGSGRSLALAKNGFPIAYIAPKEGAVALQTTICPVVGSDVPSLAQQLLQKFFEPSVQTALAASAGWGPTNQDTILDPSLAASVPYGQEAIGRLIAVDWKRVNQQRADWTRRWTREIEN
jgi:putative spermidine/putrescine transport system substrate-binding protein